MSSSHKIYNKSFVLGVDVGTTNIKCSLYDRSANIIGTSQKEISSLTNQDKMFEINPDMLWNQFIATVEKCLNASSVQASQVASMGIATQRGTFLTWDRDTGEYFHNFISWKDQRTHDLCKKWNSSFRMKILQIAALLLYSVTFIAKFQVFSKIKFSPAMVLPRLYFVLNSIPEVQTRCQQGRVLFGTLDTWLLWKLTSGKSHFTDPSNACITGFFDHFNMTWSTLILKAFHIPLNILPKVKNTCDLFGETDESIFGSAIPICSLVGDQQASMFGAQCFQKYDISCTMGTGSFLTINTGDRPSLLYPGLFPLVGWSIKSKTTYIAECGFHNFGPAVKWLQTIGFINNPGVSSTVAQSVKDTNGVYFVPAENLQMTSDAGKFTFVNLDLNASKEHLVRSVLESLAFQVVLLFGLMIKVFQRRRNVLKICGGVSQNNFVIQLVSDITSVRVERLQYETSSLGAAFFAGLNVGFWKSLEDLQELELRSDIFVPSESVDKRILAFAEWKKILNSNSLKNISD